jgi:hypothetical protein
MVNSSTRTVVETQYRESKKLTRLYSFDFVQRVVCEAKKYTNTRKPSTLKTFSFTAEGMSFVLFNTRTFVDSARYHTVGLSKQVFLDKLIVAQLDRKLNFLNISKIHFPLHKSPEPDPVMIQTNPICIFHCTNFKHARSTFVHSRLSLPNCLPIRFFDKYFASVSN